MRRKGGGAGITAVVTRGQMSPYQYYLPSLPASSPQAAAAAAVIVCVYPRTAGSRVLLV